MIRSHRWVWLTLLLICALLALIPFEPVINTQLSHILTVTLAVYAVARGLNAVVSMAQGTELSIEPLGVGVTLAPGEILDPLNDLIEQVSTILLIASASIGVQKIILAVGDIPIFRWLIISLSLISLLTLFIPKTPDKLQTVLIKTVFIITIIRAIVPIMVVVSNYSQQWLTDEREQAISVLVATQQEVKELNQSTSQDKSWIEDIKSSLSIDVRLKTVKQQAEHAIQATIYILSEFVLVFVLLPIMLGYLMLLIIRKVTTN